jgi:hypothetical protein
VARDPVWQCARDPLAEESAGLVAQADAPDRQIHETKWFYVPPYDDAWDAARGHWAAARGAERGAARAESYRQAIDAWGS